jgi:pilus assembly protein Flp/PilA
MRDFFCRLRSAETGATAVEYGLICALIVIAAIAGISALADATIGMWTDVAQNVLTRS